MAEPNDRRLEELAESVSEGRAVDWPAAEEAAASEEERRVVGALRAISEIAAVNRTLQEAAGPAGPPPAPPERWGHLEVLERVGEGSFGEVFRARDTKLDRVVALKLLSRRDDAGRDRSTVEEGRLLARVRHPNVAAVYGADERDGRTGLWMEFLEGRTLSELLRERGPLGAREAALVGIDLCRALAAVHAQGILHRDVKAQNVVRETGGRIVLTDFGIGRDLEGEEPEPEERRLSGTPLYLAPELFEGEPATVRSDLYSLGVLLFHLATGSFPVQGRSVDEIRRAHERGEAALLRDVRPDLPEPFIRAVERALASDPARRYLTAGAFEQALSDVVQLDETGSRGAGARAGRRRAVPAIVAVGIVAVLGVFAFVLWPDEENRKIVARQRYDEALELHSDGQIEDAIRLLESAVELDPDFAMAHARLGMYLGGVGNFEKSFEASERALQLSKELPAVDRSWIAANYHLDRLQFEEALKELEGAIPPEGADPERFRQLAMLQANLGDARLGIEPAEKARNLPPPSVINHGVHALLLAWADLPEAALQEAHEGRKLFEGSKDVVYLNWPEGVARLLQDDLDGAASAFREMASGDSPYVSHGRILLAQSLMMEGRISEAANELERRLDVDDRKGYDRNGALRAFLRAKAAALQGAREDVARHLKLVDRLPDLPPSLRIFRMAAILAAETGDMDRAERLLARIETIAEEYPSHFARAAEAHVHGEIARAQGDLGAARDAFEEARQLWGDPAILVSIGRFRLENGQCGKALSAFEEALASEGRGLGSFFFVWSDLSRLEKDVREQCPDTAM